MPSSLLLSTSRSRRLVNPGPCGTSTPLSCSRCNCHRVGSVRRGCAKGQDAGEGVGCLPHDLPVHRQGLMPRLTDQPPSGIGCQGWDFPAGLLHHCNATAALGTGSHGTERVWGHPLDTTTTMTPSVRWVGMLMPSHPRPAQSAVHTEHARTPSPQGQIFLERWRLVMFGQCSGQDWVWEARKLRRTPLFRNKLNPSVVPFAQCKHSHSRYAEGMQPRPARHPKAQTQLQSTPRYLP